MLAFGVPLNEMVAVDATPVTVVTVPSQSVDVPMFVTPINVVPTCVHVQPPPEIPVAQTVDDVWLMTSTRKK